MLEALVIHLRNTGMSNIKIARTIGKDPRNVYTVYKRAKRKITVKNKK